MSNSRDEICEAHPGARISIVNVHPDSLYSEDFVIIVHTQKLIIKLGIQNGIKKINIHYFEIIQ